MALEFINKWQEALKLSKRTISAEADLLQSWIDNNRKFGWSTNLETPMRERRTELLNVLHALNKAMP